MSPRRTIIQKASTLPCRPDAQGGPVRRRQPLVRPPDDAARRPGGPVRPAASAALRERRGEDLPGIRQAVLALRPVRECGGHRCRHHARPKTGGVGGRGKAIRPGGDLRTPSTSFIRWRITPEVIAGKQVSTPAPRQAAPDELVRMTGRPRFAFAQLTTVLHWS
jgi:hypothetical protein